MSMSVDVIYALHLKPGDLWAGIVDRNAPTTPVQPFAAAIPVTTVDTVTDEAGAKWQHVNSIGELGGCTPVPAAMQVLVIRRV